VEADDRVRVNQLSDPLDGAVPDKLIRIAWSFHPDAYVMLCETIKSPFLPKVQAEWLLLRGQ
jgi:hypothetical protein